MQIEVTKDKVIIKEKTSINKGEYQVNECVFNFSEEYSDNVVKKAIFETEEHKIEMLIVNDKCHIPNEILLGNKIQVNLRVYGYVANNEELVLRYSPSYATFMLDRGSYITDTENTEPITSTDKEQVEQAIQEMETKVDNLNIDGEKIDHTTTITITYKDGTSKELTLEDGKSIEYNWQGTELGIRQEGESTYQYVDLKGDKGDAGAIKMLIVAELPETGANDTIYLVPITPDTSGNNYAEYIYINGAWELLGKIGVQVDLSDYVKNTDYASGSKYGVVKVGSYGVSAIQGVLTAIDTSYADYLNESNGYFIGKGTLENVITGKDLTTKSYVDSLVGDLETILTTLDIGSGVNGN